MTDVDHRDAAGSATRKNGKSEFTSFDEYFKVDFRPLVGFLVLQGARLAEAEDAAQEGMIEVAKRWSAIENPKAYARTTALRAYLRMVPERTPPIATRGSHRVALDSDMAINTASLNDWVSILAEMDSVGSAIQQLPDKQRTAVAYFISGLSSQEVAKVTGSEPATARSNLRHGLKALRHLLEPKSESPTRMGREK